MQISLKAYLGVNSKYKEIEMRNIISTVWSKAATVRGKDPDLYRRDPYNNVMYKYSYGKASNMGWEIDHIVIRLWQSRALFYYKSLKKICKHYFNVKFDNAYAVR